MYKLFIATIFGLTTCLSSVALADGPIDRPGKTLQEEPPLLPNDTGTPFVSPVVVEAKPEIKTETKTDVPATKPDTYTPKIVVVDAVVPAPQLQEPKPRLRYGVVDINCGVPSGCVAEMGFRPFYWLKLEVGAGYNGMAPGVIGSIVLDPIPFPVGITLSMDAGHYWSGPVPFVNNAPSVEYSFISPMAGLEFGNYKAWRFYLRGGLTYLDMTGSNFGSTFNISNSNGLSIGNPRVDGWFAPAFKFGFTFYL